MTAALVAAAVSAIVSLAVALAQLRQGKQSQLAQVQLDITNKSAAWSTTGYNSLACWRLRIDGGSITSIGSASETALTG